MRCEGGMVRHRGTRVGHNLMPQICTTRCASLLALLPLQGDKSGNRFPFPGAASTHPQPASRPSDESTTVDGFSPSPAAPAPLLHSPFAALAAELEPGSDGGSLDSGRSGRRRPGGLRSSRSASSLFGRVLGRGEASAQAEGGSLRCSRRSPGDADTCLTSPIRSIASSSLRTHIFSTSPPLQLPTGPWTQKSTGTSLVRLPDRPACLQNPRASLPPCCHQLTPALPCLAPAPVHPHPRPRSRDWRAAPGALRRERAAWGHVPRHRGHRLQGGRQHGAAGLGGDAAPVFRGPDHA